MDSQHLAAHNNEIMNSIIKYIDQKTWINKNPLTLKHEACLININNMHLISDVKVFKTMQKYLI